MCGSAHFCNQKEEVGIIGDFPKILAYSLFPICGVTTSDGSHLHSLLAFVPLEQQRQVHGGFECLMWCEMIGSSGSLHHCVLGGGEGLDPPSYGGRFDESVWKRGRVGQGTSSLRHLHHNGNALLLEAD